MALNPRVPAAGRRPGLSWLGTASRPSRWRSPWSRTGGGAGRSRRGLATRDRSRRLVCTLFGGVWADRLQPQRVMVAGRHRPVRAAGGHGRCMFATGIRSLLLLCALVAVGSARRVAVLQPAMTALKPMLVPAEQRQSANAMLSLLKTGCSMARPGAGGLAVAAFGAPAGFAVNAVSFLASVATVLLIRARAARAPRAGMLRELRAGWRRGAQPRLAAVRRAGRDAVPRRQRRGPRPRAGRRACAISAGPARSASSPRPRGWAG